ncbi:hypothetical protein NMY22_g3746 [Coprinellus aureogranulatus]|nr:hypothetical protein NMY22_g3746 [Coprinellus aureogranulatus]
MPGRRTFLVGGGCTAFIKPRGQRAPEDMGLEAATKALLDAGINYDEANNAVKYGQVECALALGFERMKPGSLGSNFPDRPNPMILFHQKSHELEAQGLGANHGPGAPRLFDNGAQEYFNKYGGGVEHLAKIASKNHKHSKNNPYSQFRDGWSEEQVLKAAKITRNLTKFMCSPTSDGAAACVVASEDFVHAHGLENQAIEIVAQTLSTDGPTTFESDSAMDVVGYTMTKVAADQTFADAGFKQGEGRDLVGVIELHDCFAANEFITYPALGLCKEDEAHKFVERGDNTYGGKFVVNPSGGLEAKGHPLGATGLGMHFYIMMQLRNWAGPMQAPGLFDIADKRGKYGLVHNVGLGGAVVVSLLRRPEFYKEGGEDGRDRLGYNHAHECRPVTMADVDKVKSRKGASKYVLAHAKLQFTRKPSTVVPYIDPLHDMEPVPDLSVLEDWKRYRPSTGGYTEASLENIRSGDVEKLFECLDETKGDTGQFNEAISKAFAAWRLASEQDNPNPPPKYILYQLNGDLSEERLSVAHITHTEDKRILAALAPPAKHYGFLVLLARASIYLKATARVYGSDDELYTPDDLSLDDVEHESTEVAWKFASLDGSTIEGNRSMEDSLYDGIERGGNVYNCRIDLQDESGKESEVDQDGCREFSWISIGYHKRGSFLLVVPEKRVLVTFRESPPPMEAKTTTVVENFKAAVAHARQNKRKRRW